MLNTRNNETVNFFIANIIQKVCIYIKTKAVNQQIAAVWANTVGGEM